jgi:hypothetical protein
LSLASDDPLFGAYRTWLGIKHFWGPTGPVATGQPPQKGSSDVGDEAAYQLKQQHIFNYKTVIQKNLA